MVGKKAGSVSARIELDTSQFEEAIAKLKKQTENAKQAVNQSAEGTASAIENLVQTTNKLKEEQSKLSSQVNNTSEGIKKEADKLKQLSPELEKNTKNIQNNVKANEDLRKSQDNVTKSLKEEEKQAKKTMSVLAKELYQYTSALADSSVGMGKTKVSLANLKKEFADVSKDAKELENLIIGAMESINAPFNKDKKGFDISNLKKPLLDVAQTTEKVAESTDKVATSYDALVENTKKATEVTKQLGEASKHTATELELLNAMYDHFQYRKGLGDVKAPFVATYKNWEEEYKHLLTQLDPKFAKRIRKQFQKTFKGLAEELGVVLSPETVLLPDGSQKSVNFLGERIGSYDLTNLIDEKEFKRLIGEVEELGEVEEQTALKTNKLGVAIEQLGIIMKGANFANFGRSKGVVDALTKMAELNEAHNYLPKIISKSERFINELKRNKYNFGFTGADAKDTRFIENTLDELMYGNIHGSGRIRPRNPLIRLFAPEEMKFAEYLFSKTQKWSDEENNWVHKGVIPYKDFFTSDMYWGEPSWVGRLGTPYATDDKESKKIAQQVAQKAMRKVFDYLGVELIEATGRGGHKFDGQRISGIDVTALGDNWINIRNSMDKAVDTLKIIEMEEDKIHAKELKIHATVENTLKRLPEEKREVMNICEEVDYLTNKLIKLDTVSQKIANREFKLGFKPNFKHIAKELGEELDKAMETSLKTLYMNPRSLNYKKHRPEDGWDNDLMGHKSKYVELSGILGELYQKHKALNLSVREFNDLLSKNLKYSNKYGTFMDMTKPYGRYYPTTGELEDLELSKIKQGEKGFRNLMASVEELGSAEEKTTTTTNQLTTSINSLTAQIIPNAQKANTSLNKFHEQNRKNLTNEIRLVNEYSTAYRKAKQEVIEFVWSGMSRLRTHPNASNIIAPITSKQINKWLPAFSTASDRKQAVKQTQQEVEKILKSIGVVPSTSIYEDSIGRKSKKTRWATGEKGFMMGSLDISNVEEFDKLVRKTVNISAQLEAETKQLQETFSEEIPMDTWDNAWRALEILYTAEERASLGATKLVSELSKIKYDDYVKIARLTERELNALEGIFRATYKYANKYGLNGHIFGIDYAQLEKWAEEVQAWAKLLPRLDLGQFFNQYWDIGGSHNFGNDRFEKHMGRSDVHQDGGTFFRIELDKVAHEEDEGKREIELLKRIQSELEQTEIKYSELAHQIQNVKRILNEPYGYEKDVFGYMLEELGELKYSNLTSYGREANKLVSELTELVYGGLFLKAEAQANKLNNAIEKLSSTEKTTTSTTNQLVASVKKLGSSWKVGLKPIKETTSALKEEDAQLKDLLATLKEVNLEAQLRVNRQAYSYLNQYKDSKYLPEYRHLQLMTNDYHYSDEENEKMLNNALKAMNAMVVKGKLLLEEEEGLVVTTNNLKKPILDVIDLENKLANSSDNVISAKQREAKEFKKYTAYEITLMENLNSLMRDYTINGTTLFPIDHYTGMSGHKSEYSRNYSSLLKSIKRNENYVNRGIKDKNIYHTTGQMLSTEGYDTSDTTKFVQSRLRDIIHDLGGTFSDVVDDEYKKVRSKISKGMVEYVDVSDMPDNSEWLKEVRNQLWEFKRFEKEIEKFLYGVKKGYWYDSTEFKKAMDSASRHAFERYGYGGNPYIKDYIQERGLKKYYTQIQQRPHSYSELNYGRNPIYITKKISDGILSLDKTLKQTPIDLELLKIENAGEKVASSTKEVSEDLKQMGETSVETSENVDKLTLSLQKEEIQIWKTRKAQREADRLARRKIGREQAVLYDALRRLKGTEIHPHLSQKDFEELDATMKNVSNDAEKLKTTITTTAKESGKEVDAFTTKINHTGNAIKKIISLVETEKNFYGKEGTLFGTGRMKFLQEQPSINDAKTQADLLGVMLGNASNQANNLATAIKNVGNSSKTTAKEVGQLVMAVKRVGEPHAIFGSDGLIWNDVRNISNKEFLEAYVTYRRFIKEITQPVGISGYQSNITHIFDTIREKAEALSRAYQQMHQSGQSFGISKYHEFVGELDAIARKAREAREAVNSLKESVKSTEPPLENLPIVLEKVAEESKKAGESASESFKEAREESERFYREQQENARRYYNEQKEQWKRQQTEMGEFSLKNAKNIFQQLNAIDRRIEELYGKARGSVNSRWLRMPRMSGEYNIVSFEKEIAHTTTALKTFDNTVLQVARDIHKSLYESMKEIYKLNAMSDEPIKLPIDNWKEALSEISAFELRYTALMQRMYNLSRGLGQWQNQGKEPTGYGKLLENMKRNPIYEWVKEGDTWIRKFKGFQKTIEEVREGSLGRLNVVGYSDYIAHITEIQAKLQEAKAPADQFKESLKLLSEALKLNANSMTDFVGKSEGVIASLTQMAQANERFAQQPTQVEMVSEIEKIGQVLNHFSSMGKKGSNSLSGLRTQLLAIRDSTDVLTKSLLDGSLSQEQYEKELLQLSNRLKQLGEESTQAIRKLNMLDESAEKTSDGFKKGQRSVREFGKTLGESERYADTLYRGLQKVRSIIISLKTIGRMMGTMEIWNFAFELIESAKETYVAKNEMESLLKQNSKISTSGIDVYNKALDETISRFQKINKYSLGETGASIGLEFNLNAQEMAKSLPVIAMIQNEYVRAGRTVEEASLAVKDILQGEFMRLSRETGIGKEDLTEKYGWNGDKTDVLNLMKALEKAGKERHWDLFAEKATSLNDILTITKSRFSELGAELGTHAEPLIVGTFNTILGVVDALKTGFEGLGSFGKTMVGAGGIVGGFVALSSVYLALAKNMGFLDIATMGFNKSLASSILHLNKQDVVMHGFWKTLIATTSGTKVATIETIGLKKAIAGRLLGVKQSAIAEVGFKNALVGTISKYKEEIPIIQMGNKARGAKINLDKATSIVEGKLVSTELNRSQRLAYLTTNLKYNEVAELSRGKALLKSATSAKVLFNALKLVGTVGIIAYFASLVSWTDKVKSYVTGFYNVVDNGKTLIKDAKADIKANSDALTDINAKIDKYNSKNKDTTALLREKNGLLKDEKIAQQNLTNVQKANDLAKTASENLQNRRSRINTHHTRQLAEAYMKLGLDSEKATLEANNYYSQVKVGSYYANQALDEYDTRLTNATNHALSHAQSLQKMGVDQDTVNQYMMDYNLIAEETAEHWRKFNEGDIWEGFSGLMGDLKLAWTDFTYTPEFQKLVDGLKDWYNWLKPSLETIIEYLKELGKSAIDAFSWLTSTDMGNLVLTVTTLGSVLSLGALKIAKWLTGAKSVGTVLKDLGGKLKDRIKDWKDYNDVTGDKKSSPDTKTDVEGKKNPNYRDKRYSGWGELGADIKQDTFKEIRKFAKYAVQLAGVMVLVTEAIILLEAPMFALAEVGKVFKAKEKSIKAGIEGIKIIAPIIVAFLIPIGLLMKVMDKWSTQLSNWKTWASTALGIAGGMLLVTEAIAMLIPPLWAMGALGDQYMGIKTQVKKGAEAMKLISESLIYLLPFVPAMVLGVALVDAMFTALPLGASALVIVAGGIALGMGLVAEAIWTLQAPLWAIGDIGKNFKDLSNVKQGAEALKLSAEALGYVAEGVASLAVITWEDLVANIGRLVSQRLGISLTGLTGEGGFFDQLNTFMKEFNSDELQIEAPQPEKVQALASVGEGINTISSAMESVKTAMENIPDEFKNGGASLSYDMETDKTQVNTYDVEGYFDTFKEPLRQLKTFIEDFNTSDEFDFGDGIDASRVEAIQSAGSMIETLNNAVTQVKTVMQGIGDSQWNTAYAEGGILSAVGNFLFHQTGEGSINNGQSSGSYKSSIGSSLQEMENVISDLFTFQTNVNNLTGGSGEGTDVSGATAMVTTIQTAITNLATSLSDAIPTFEGKGNAISSAIVRGIKTGFSDLGATITNEITDAIDGAKDSAETYGKGLGSKLKSGFKDNLKIKDTTSTEVDYTFEYLDGKEQAFYDKGAMLGDALSRGFKEHKGLDQQSPGRIARTVHDELDFVSGFFQNGLINLPQMAMNLGNALSSNFNFDLGLGNLQLPDLSQFQQGLGSIIPMVTGVKDSVSLQFDTMKTNIGGAFSGILSNTKLNMGGMLSATTKNIGAIRTSWKGMQSALISSAEYIKTQTGQKIDKLKTNMGDFWNKIQHPDQLIGSAGGHQGTIRRRYGGSSMLKGLYAGGTSSPTPNIKFDLQKYLECMMDTGGNCYAGGWSFNWNKSIQSKFNGWNTHFGKYKIDDFVKVGKFADSNFPVKGIADIAKAYIFDTIRATDYDKYFNSKFGEDPVSALRAGAFNCWDGTNIILAIARAFGFEGSRGHGTWNGIGHVWADIPGLGIIDPTAIQNRGTFTSSAVKGYHAGGTTTRNSSTSNMNMGNTYGDINITINNNGKDMTIDEKKIDKETSKKIWDIINPSLNTGL